MRNLTYAVLAVLALTASATPVTAVSNPYASTTAVDSIAIKQLIVFGDSYSSYTTIEPFWKWSTQFYYDVKNIFGKPQAEVLLDEAKGGSTGGNYGSLVNDYFDAQASRFFATPHTFGPADLTVVYFGYNDMTQSVSADWPGMAKPLADYHASLQRLIKAGMASGGRRIFLIMPHDWGHTPWFKSQGTTIAAKVRQNTQQWDAGVAKMALDNSAVNVVAVDLFTAMECVFRQPADFGFVNVSDSRPQQGLNPDQWLYDYNDIYHFAGHGQQLIRQVIQYYLTKGWNWSNKYKSPSKAKAHLVADLKAGMVFPGVSCQ